MTQTWKTKKCWKKKHFALHILLTLLTTLGEVSKPAFTCPKLTIETLEHITHLVLVVLLILNRSMPAGLSIKHKITFISAVFSHDNLHGGDDLLHYWWCYGGRICWTVGVCSHMVNDWLKWMFYLISGRCSLLWHYILLFYIDCCKIPESIKMRDLSQITYPLLILRKFKQIN